MIEKMKHVTLTGTLTELDRIIERYIIPYDIQLVYSDGVSALIGKNPFEEAYQKAEGLKGMFEAAPKDDRDLMTKDVANGLIIYAANMIEEQDNDLAELEQRRDAISKTIELLAPFEDMDFHFADLKRFRFISYRFGKIPLSGFKQFEAFLYEESDIIFLQGKIIQDSMWWLYFTPAMMGARSASVLNSLHFKPIDMPLFFEDLTFEKSPRETIIDLRSRKDTLQKAIDAMRAQRLNGIGVSKAALTIACDIVREAYLYNECRKYASSVSEDYFTFVGWMVERDAIELEERTLHDEHAMIIMEDISENVTGMPPTKLRNNFIVRPFEFFVRMYGVPNYYELDPTPFVAITYSLLFGIMFGDVGQGAVLSLVGFLLKKWKGFALGSIMVIIGCFSILFGFVYGSIFGIENDLILPALLLRPSHSITQMLVLTVSLGVGVILLSIILNMVNSVKARNIGLFLFGPNSLSGLVFYLAIIICVLLNVVFGFKTSAMSVVALTLLPLLAITFKEPLSHAVNKRKQHTATTGSVQKMGIGMYIVEAIMELIEVLLAFFTNTVSFLRVGGFAVAHAGLMSAVMILAKADSGSPNIPLIIFGNILVLIIEGVVVGIQVLRLQFYEMFSRYYKGDGMEFESFRSKL
jgi:V/A-type H+-transporting ATPase subunit I